MTINERYIFSDNANALKQIKSRWFLNKILNTPEIPFHNIQILAKYHKPNLCRARNSLVYKGTLHIEKAKGNSSFINIKFILCSDSTYKTILYHLTFDFILTSPSLVRYKLAFPFWSHSTNNITDDQNISSGHSYFLLLFNSALTSSPAEGNIPPELSVQAVQMELTLPGAMALRALGTSLANSSTWSQRLAKR